MARICVEYECDVQESQRRPANLLDALERGDHCSGEDNDTVMGAKVVLLLLFSTCQKRLFTKGSTIHPSIHYL